MLLETLIGKTSPEHADYTDLSAALEIIKDVTSAVNEAAKDERSSETEAETLRRELVREAERQRQRQSAHRSSAAADNSQLTLLQKEKHDAETQRRAVEEMNAKLAQALAERDAELKALRDGAAA
jgi:hypothetical protein